MQTVTLAIAGVLSILIFQMTPVYGLFGYFIGLSWYPQSVSAPIGNIDFTVGRIVIIAVYITTIFRTRLIREFTWKPMDTFVLAFAAGKLLSLSTTVPFNTFFVRESGQFMDLVLPYFAVRLIINSKQRLLKFIKLLVIVALPLALIGVFQALTGENPYSFGYEGTYFRRGYYRAYASFGNYIVFGLFFAGIIPLLLGLHWSGIWGRKKIIFYTVIILAGMFSSMSSAPMFSIVVSAGILAFFPLRRYFSILILVIIGFLTTVDFYSNRSWYEVVTRFSMDESTAYYRIGLVREAFGGGMDGRWMRGFGYVGIGPGTDNTHFHWVHQDLVNIYISMLVFYGLIGLVPFMVMNFLYYYQLRKAYKFARTDEDQWIIWCIFATVAGWNVAMMTVSAMGQVNTLLYAIGALCVNLTLFPEFIGKKMENRGLEHSFNRNLKEAI